MIPIWAMYFSDEKRRETQLVWMQKLVSCFRAVDAFIMAITFLTTGAAGAGNSGNVGIVGFLLVLCVARFFYSPFTYWRVSSQAWCIDEWQHRTGVREEALFFSVHAFWYELGRGFLASLTFAGIGLIGKLDSKDCLKECASFEENTRPHSDCMDVCYDQNLEQPKSLTTYIWINYGVVLPILELCCAYFTWNYPITGDRLRELYENQSKTFVVVDIEAARIRPDAILATPLSNLARARTGIPTASDESRSGTSPTASPWRRANSKQDAVTASKSAPATLSPKTHGDAADRYKVSPTAAGED